MIKRNMISKENFDKIVQIQEEYFSDNVLSAPMQEEDATQVILKRLPDLIDESGQNVLKNRIMAVLNPATRSFAYDNYVEKEKRYIFEYKQLSDNGDIYRLSELDGIIVLVDDFTTDMFTKQEVEDAGYDLDKFRIVEQL